MPSAVPHLTSRENLFMTSARSTAAVLFGLTFALGAPAPEAQAQNRECIQQNGNKCGGTEPGCNPSGQQPKKCAGADLVLGTADDLVDPSLVRAAVANTGFGGSAGTGSETTILLVGGGVLALGAAFGVRRARGAKA